MFKKFAAIFSVGLMIMLLPVAFLLHQSYAQSDGVAFLSVTSAGVELQRSGSDLWVNVNVESVVGPGDRIRTNVAGTATITFIVSDLVVELEPETEFVITTLQRDGDAYRVSVEIPEGRTHQYVDADSDTESAYEVVTPGSSLVFSEAAFDVDVDADGMTKLLAESGTINAIAGGNVNEVQEGNGLRIDADGVMSSVLPVTNFDQLDTAIDGLTAVFTTEADVALNVRQGPSRNQTILVSISPDDINLVMGVSEDGNWYRIPYRTDAFGWVSGQGLTVAVDKSLLVSFPQDYVEVTTSPTVATTTTTTPSVPAEEAPGTAEQAEVFSLYSEEELRLLAAMNEWRLEEGLAPFQPNPILTRMARDQARYLLSLPSLPNDLHRDAAGRYPHARAISDQYNWPYYSTQARVSIGENIWVGANLNGAMTYWRTDEIHRITAVSPAYREIGVAALPHPWGHMYITVFGGRPNQFPVLADLDQDILYLTDEEYEFASGGDWIVNLQEYQIVPTILTPLEDDAWQPFAREIPLPGTEPFAIAFKGDDRVVVAEVDPLESIVVLNSNIPVDEPVSTNADTADPVLILPTNTPSP